MLNKDQRKVVNAIRDAAIGIEIRILFKDRSQDVLVEKDKKLCHDVAIALQDYYNRKES